MNSGNSFDDVTDNKMKKHPNFRDPVYRMTFGIQDDIPAGSAYREQFNFEVLLWGINSAEVPILQHIGNN